MKQRFYLLIVLLLVATVHVGLYAQNNGSRHNASNVSLEQRMEKQTVQIAKALMLDEVTSDKFSKVYKEYLRELSLCQLSSRSLYTKGGKGKPMTDAEIEASIQKRFDLSRKILDIREKYYKEFKKILKPRQIMKVYAEERENRSKIMKELELRKNKIIKK